MLIFYVIEIKTTVFPIYPNFDFEIAKNASQPVLEIFDKYYLSQCLLSASKEKIMAFWFKLGFYRVPTLCLNA